MFDYLEYFFDFFGQVLLDISDKLVYDPIISKFVFIPIGVAVIFIVIDLVFDIRDSSQFSSFTKENLNYYPVKIRLSKAQLKRVKRFVANENSTTVKKNNDVSDGNTNSKNKSNNDGGRVRPFIYRSSKPKKNIDVEYEE